MMFKNLLTVSLLNLNMIPSTLCASFPPFSLIAPEFDSILPFNQAIEIGFEDNPPVLGLNRSIFISATYPRETEARVLYFDGPLYSGGRGFCQSSTNFTVHLQTDQAGRYSVFLNWLRKIYVHFSQIRYPLERNLQPFFRPITSPGP